MQLKDTDLLKTQMLIGGAWRDAASGATLDDIDPATQAPVGTVPNAGTADTRDAIAAAAAAYPAWKARPNAERARLIEAWHDLMLKNVDDLALLLTSEQGKPL